MASNNKMGITSVVCVLEEDEDGGGWLVLLWLLTDRDQ